MKSRVWFAAAVAALASIVYTVDAQRISETVQVTVIEVPVTVVDRDGNSVSGLTKENFEVTDDGKRVPIEYFEAIDMKKITTEQLRGADVPPPAHRNFLLLFDLANSSPGTIGRASSAARDFVDKQLGPNDLAAVSVFTTEGGAKMVTAFTADRGVLRTAIETLGHPKYFKVADPLMISVATPSSAPTTGGRDGGVTGGQDAVAAVIAEELEQQNALSSRVQAAEMRTRLRMQLNQFGAVARALDRLQGQKQVVLLSEGFDASLVTGRSLGAGSTQEEQQSLQQENDQVFSGEAYNIDSEKRFGSTTSNTDIQQMADLFRRSDVVLHAIDIKGVRSGVDAASGAKRSSNEGLFLITKPTGGTVFQNANDMTENFSRMLRQQETIYVLGFAARGTGKPGKFHNLKVKVNNAPRGVRVSSRAGYYEPSNKISDLERALTLAEMLMTDAPMKDVDLTVSATTLPGPGGRSRVPVLVEIPGQKLLSGVTGDTTTANLYLYAFDKDSKVVDFLQQRIALDLKKAGDTVRNSGIRYFGTLRLPPGDYAVKALLRVEDTGKTGLVRNDIKVPAFDSATILPPVLFADPANWAMLVGPARGDDYPYPFATGDARFIPQTRPTVKAGTDYNVALFLYRVPLENLGVTPAVVSSNGASQTPNVKLLGRTAADDRGGVKLLFNFRPDGIPAGEHQLRFTVKTKDGNESVVTLPFIVL